MRVPIQDKFSQTRRFLMVVLFTAASLRAQSHSLGPVRADGGRLFRRPVKVTSFSKWPKAKLPKHPRISSDLNDEAEGLGPPPLQVSCGVIR